MSNISWTEQTWNPIVGCSIASSGCKNCYAMAMAARLQCMSDKNPQYDGTTKYVNGKSVWTGKVAQAPESILMKPLKRKKPTIYFVNSMGDLFHEDVPDEWIDKVFAVMALCPQHTFQILTKRAERMQEYFAQKFLEVETAKYRIVKIISDICKEELNKPTFDVNRPTKSYVSARIALNRLVGVNVGMWTKGEWPMKTVWLGVSAENQEQAKKRIPHLLETPSAIRFVSVEPQLDYINLRQAHISKHLLPRVDWVIQGCESGHGARSFNIEWARSIRDECEAVGVSYFLKQIQDENGKVIKEPFLDGVQHLSMPEISR